MQNFAEARSSLVMKAEPYSVEIVGESNHLESYLADLNSRLHSHVERLCGVEVGQPPAPALVKPAPRGGSLGEIHGYIHRCQDYAANIEHHINRLATL